MTSYDYKGYTISETSDGYYQVGEYEFSSFDEAMDWIDEDVQDDIEDVSPYNEVLPQKHKYLIYFAEYGLDQGSMMPVDAYSEAEAESWLRRHFDVAYITDIREIT